MEKNLVKKIKGPVKNIVFLIAGFSIFVVGLLYVLLSDLLISNTAGWLFISIILTFGSGACMIFSESCREKPIAFYILKFSSILLGIGFIIFIYLFKDSKFCLEIKAEMRSPRDLIIMLSLILGYFAVATQIANTILNLMFKEE